MYEHLISSHSRRSNVSAFVISPVFSDVRPSVHDGPGLNGGASPDHDSHDVHVRGFETSGVKLAVHLGAVADLYRIKFSKEPFHIRGPSHLLCERKSSKRSVICVREVPSTNHPIPSMYLVGADRTAVSGSPHPVV